MIGRSGVGSTACWFALTAGLAGFVALEMAEDVSLTPAVTAAPIETVSVSADERAVMIVETPSSDILNDIVERPLFSASRRPFEAVDEKPDTIIQEPDQKLALQLVGTMLSGASRVVLLKHPTEGLLRLRQGQSVENWVVGDIDDHRVELRNGDEVEWLKLRTDLLPLDHGKKRPAAPGKPKKTGLEAATAVPPSTGATPAPAQE